VTLAASDFDFTLSPDLIAQHPASPRDAARLLVVGDALADRVMRDLPDLLRPGDLLVANDTRSSKPRAAPPVSASRSIARWPMAPGTLWPVTPAGYMSATR